MLRPAQWWHFALLPAASLRPDQLAHPAFALLSLLQGSLIAALSLAFAYGINAIHDRATDRSTAKNPLAGSAIVAPETRALVWASGALAVGVATAAGPRAAMCGLISVLVGAAYSAAPRLKSYPLLGTSLNVGIFLPLMWVAAPGAPRRVLPVTFTALLLQNQLWHEREDEEEDRAAGVQTTAALLGERGTAAASCAIGAAGAAAVLLSGASLAEAAAACVACAVGSAAPLAAGPSSRRAIHRAASIACGAVVFAAAMWSS